MDLIVLNHNPIFSKTKLNSKEIITEGKDIKVKYSISKMDENDKCVYYKNSVQYIFNMNLLESKIDVKLVRLSDYLDDYSRNIRITDATSTSKTYKFTGDEILLIHPNCISNMITLFTFSNIEYTCHEQLVIFNKKLQMAKCTNTGYLFPAELLVIIIPNNKNKKLA